MRRNPQLVKITMFIYIFIYFKQELALSSSGINPPVQKTRGRPRKKGTLVIFITYCVTLDNVTPSLIKAASTPASHSVPDESDENISLITPTRKKAAVRKDVLSECITVIKESNQEYENNKVSCFFTFIVDDLGFF